MKVKIFQAYDSQIGKLEAKVNEWLHEQLPPDEEVKQTNLAATGEDGTARVTSPFVIITIWYDKK